MKLIFVIVSNDDAGRVYSELAKSGFWLISLSATGGFLSSGNTVFLCAVEEERVDAAIETIKEHSAARTQNLPVNASFGVGTHGESPTEILSGGAAVFVIDVERFEKV